MFHDPLAKPVKIEKLLIIVVVLVTSIVSISTTAYSLSLSFDLKFYFSLLIGTLIIVSAGLTLKLVIDAIRNRRLLIVILATVMFLNMLFLSYITNFHAIYYQQVSQEYFNNDISNLTGNIHDLNNYAVELLESKKTRITTDVTSKLFQLRSDIENNNTSSGDLRSKINLINEALGSKVSSSDIPISDLSDEEKTSTYKSIEKQATELLQLEKTKIDNDINSIRIYFDSIKVSPAITSANTFNNNFENHKRPEIIDLLSELNSILETSTVFLKTKSVEFNNINPAYELKSVEIQKIPSLLNIVFNENKYNANLIFNIMLAIMMDFLWLFLFYFILDRNSTRYYK